MKRTYKNLLIALLKNFISSFLRSPQTYFPTDTVISLPIQALPLMPKIWWNGQTSGPIFVESDQSKALAVGLQSLFFFFLIFLRESLTVLIVRKKME